MIASHPEDAVSPEWAVLFYLCGHFHRADRQDPFAAALDDIRQASSTLEIGVAAHLDLESGARRLAMRPGDAHHDIEALGTVNSGDPDTLDRFLSWSFDVCPARRYILVMAGLGVGDSESVFGRPPLDASRLFAVCDDLATGDAIELHELSTVLRRRFPAEGAHRLIVLACDMYATQFMEVAYELREQVDFLVGLQPGQRAGTAPAPWPYARLIVRWQEIIRERAGGSAPRWSHEFDRVGEALADETVNFLGAEYGARHGETPPVTVSAVNVRALGPLAQALDTFSIVYLQWLSNDVIWRARERVVTKHQDALQHVWSYDLAAVAQSIHDALAEAARDAVARWAAEALARLSPAALARVLRVLVRAAREATSSDGSLATVQAELARCRAQLGKARTLGDSAGALSVTPAPVVAAVRQLFLEPGASGAARHAEAWARLFRASRDRLPHQARELTDILEGIEAAGQLGCLARRVAGLTRPAAGGPETAAVVNVWPRGSACGLSLYRPIDLENLAESNYLELLFSRDLHWTALLTAIDLIKNHARLLWRLIESQLTAAPLAARHELMRRLAGERALTGRYANQFRALAAPGAFFLTLEPVVGEDDEDHDGPAAPEARSEDGEDPVGKYCVRLASLERGAMLVERRNRVTRRRLAAVLAEMDAIGGAVDARPDEILQRLARCGSLLGDDILFRISDHLATITGDDGRLPHLVIQIPRELMPYPWELLRDRHGFLVERFAIGRQVIAETESAGRWAHPHRHGPLRLLVVAPRVAGSAVEHATAGHAEGARVAECFARLAERLPGLVEPLPFAAYVGAEVPVDRFRDLLREGEYDVVHFAGHGSYDRDRPEHSAWQLTDGPLYAFELRHTLANARRTPWLVYGSACEAARESGRGSHQGVYGMASAALMEGVCAYLAPLWVIRDTDATNLATTFYQALMLRRTSIGEALTIARRLVRENRGTAADMPLPILGSDAAAAWVAEGRTAGWAGMVLYGDPTPTIFQRLSPSIGYDGTAMPSSARQGE